MDAPRIGVSGLAQKVGCGQPNDTGAEYDCLARGAAIGAHVDMVLRGNEGHGNGNCSSSRSINRRILRLTATRRALRLRLRRAAAPRTARVLIVATRSPRRGQRVSVVDHSVGAVVLAGRRESRTKMSYEIVKFGPAWPWQREPSAAPLTGM